MIEVLERYAATGARTLVLSADSGLAGYDTRPTLEARAGPPCWPTWTGSTPLPPSTMCARCCIRTSEP